MELIISLVITFALVLLLRKPIRSYPVVFYVLLVAIDILFLSGVLFGVSREVAVIGYPLATIIASAVCSCPSAVSCR